MTYSFIRPAPERYTRSFGQSPNQEPSQDNTDLKLVLDTLQLIGRNVDQVDITAGHLAILIGDGGDRVTIRLEEWDTPELLQPRLQKALEAMPVRWKDEDVANDLAAGMAPRIERGGLE